MWEGFYFWVVWGVVPSCDEFSFGLPLKTIPQCHSLAIGDLCVFEKSELCSVDEG